MSEEQIRPLALGIVRRDDDLLVCEFHDDEGEAFYRPLGGTIGFGERGRDALRREFREELGVELAAVHHLATLENIFTYKGQTGHEIILLYEATLADPAFYERETLEVHEENSIQQARWMPLNTFQDGGPPLYPDGLTDALIR